MSALERLAGRLGARARRDEPIGPRTTYRVGGDAALFVEIGGEAILGQVTAALRDEPVPVLVLGAGSNLLVADAGFAGLCVHLSGTFEEVSLDRDTEVVRAGGALAYPVLARRLAAAGRAGMGFAVGIPGSVGGAVVMNAGGHGAETAERLVDATIVNLASGSRREVLAAELALSYRHSNLAPDDLVLGARFRTEEADPPTLEAEISEIVSWRRANQPGGRNGGSVFTNPPGDAAGRLVEEAGLKGHRVGGAVVSDKHANFIQADAGTTADDVRRLIEEVRRLVAERLGVELQIELRLVGFAP